MTYSGAMYFSYSARGWCGIFAHLSDGRAMVRHELTFVNRTPELVAADLKALLKRQKIELRYLVAQPELFPKPKAYGETVSETFSRLGLPMWRGHADSQAGYQRVRSWLEAIDGKPMLTIHRECKQLIRTLPTLVSKSSDPDDIELVPDAYPAKALSFWAMSRPSAALIEEPELPVGAIGHDVRTLRDELSAGVYS